MRAEGLCIKLQSPLPARTEYRSVQRSRHMPPQQYRGRTRSAQKSGAGHITLRPHVAKPWTYEREAAVLFVLAFVWSR
jgi:hypothetical protein